MAKVVLVVDDDRDARETLSAILESVGFSVFQAADGREGLARARDSHPAVIILDLEMPTLDGWGFRAQQRRDGAIADVPVVVVSGAVSRLDELCPAACLGKPYDVGLLLETVGRLAA